MSKNLNPLSKEKPNGIPKSEAFKDGVIPSVGKIFANPNNSTNTATAFYNYTNKEIVRKQNFNSFK